MANLNQVAKLILCLFSSRSRVVPLAVAEDEEVNALVDFLFLA